jgi:hypothetical protein
MARTKSTPKKFTTTKATASPPSNMAPPNSASESSSTDSIVAAPDIANLRGEINGLHAAIRAQGANSSTWAAESRRRFDAIDARLDGLERLVRQGFAAGGAQLHGASVDQEAPISDTGENSGGEDQEERDVEEEEEEEEEEEDEGEADEEAEQESASEYSPEEVIKGKGVYTSYTYSDEPEKEKWGVLQEVRRPSTTEATVASAARDDTRKNKKVRKASKSDEEKTLPTPKKAPVLQSIEEGEEDVPKARDDNQQPGVAFTPRLTQPSKGKKRKAEQSDVPEVAGGK